MTSDPTISRESILRQFALPLLLALAMTFLNALKAPCIDDTAYLAVARQIASRPLDPYGFQQFWYDYPQPANEVLAPPVLPYWLGLGIRLLGERPVLLKLWLLPIALLFCYSTRQLLQRFARGSETPLLVGIAFSPSVLPAFDFMLDIPTLAIGATAVAIFLDALDRDSWPHVVLAGLLGGLAIQTKYTGGIISPVLLAASLIRGRPLKGLAANAISAAIFIGWEGFTRWKYGESHFLFALNSSGSDVIARLKTLLKAAVTLQGTLSPPLVLLAVVTLIKRRWIAPVLSGLIVFGLMVLALTPDTRDSSWHPDYAQPGIGVRAFIEWPWGLAAVAAVAIVAIRLVVRWRRGSIRFKLRWPLAFLLIWLSIEWAGYLVMTPFPASRRLLGIEFVSTLLVAYLASRACRGATGRQRLWTAIVPGVCLGLFFELVDISNTWLEPQAVDAAADWIEQQHASGKIWYTGHWGFQYAAERHGFLPLAAGYTELHEGDCLIVAPAWMAQQEFVEDGRMGPVEHVVVEDRMLRLRTLPSYYGGSHAIEWWPRPLFDARIYRIRATWTPARSPATN